MQASSVTVESSPEAVARAFYAATFTLNQRVLADLFERLAQLGMSPTQFKFLHRLQQQGAEETELSVKALGDFHCLSLATASRAVDGLVKLGFVEREECPSDRRIKRVRITAAGRETLRAVHAANVELLAEFTRTLTDAERHDLALALAPVTAKLDVRTSMEGPST